jgi:prophage regulatory protein
MASRHNARGERLNHEDLLAVIEEALDAVSVIATAKQKLQAAKTIIQSRLNTSIPDSAAAPVSANNTSDRIVGTPETLSRTSIRSRTTLWQMERRGEFPKRVRLSANRVGYRERDVLNWIASREAK